MGYSKCAGKRVLESITRYLTSMQFMNRGVRNRTHGGCGRMGKVTSPPTRCIRNAADIPVKSRLLLGRRLRPVLIVVRAITPHHAGPSAPTSLPVALPSALAVRFQSRASPVALTCPGHHCALPLSLCRLGVLLLCIDRRNAQCESHHDHQSEYNHLFHGFLLF